MALLAVSNFKPLFLASELGTIKTVGKGAQTSIAISKDGSTLALGEAAALYGTCRIFSKVDGVWTLTDTISPPGLATDYFGYSVALSADGNTLVVGAKDHKPATYLKAGCLYVFVRSGGVWTQQAKLVGSGGTASTAEAMGTSCAISSDGNIVVGGAPGYGDSTTTSRPSYAGEACVWTRSGSTWTKKGTFTTVAGPTGFYGQDRMGTSVAMSDNGLIFAVGAPTSTVSKGQVYIYTSTAGVTWVKKATLASNYITYSTFFGTSLSFNSAGTTLAVGAYGDSQLFVNAATYVFTGAEATWAVQALVESPDVKSSDLFGFKVSLDSVGTHLLMGATKSKTAAGTSVGSTYLAAFDGSAWAITSQVFSKHPALNGAFGTFVALNSNASEFFVSSAGLIEYFQT